MVGDQVKYEPVWQMPDKKRILKDTAVNDCLSSATAGLNSSSLDRIKKSKREQFAANQSKVSSGALHIEDVGLVERAGKIKQARQSAFNGRRSKH